MASRMSNLGFFKRSMGFVSTLGLCTAQKHPKASSQSHLWPRFQHRALCALVQDAAHHQALRTSVGNNILHSTGTARLRSDGTTLTSHPRAMTTSASNAPFGTVGYEEVKRLTESPEKNTYLIDVRNPNEWEFGRIPTARLVPLPFLPQALAMDPDDFEDAFGFEKPDSSARLIFHCRVGGRSANACVIAQQAGYKNVHNYEGSYLEWAEKHGLPLY